MVTKEQNKALLIVGNSAMQNPDWVDYASYCFCREKGLRKEAFRHIDNFLLLTENWKFDNKINFVKFALNLFETVPEADYGAFPTPLSKKLIEPTLIEWCGTEKIDNAPFRWYGKFYKSEEHLFKALELNPKDDLSRQTLIKWWVNSIYYSIHHLPEYYIGNPFDDIKLGEKINEHIQKLTIIELKEYWEKKLDVNLDIVLNYIDWKKYDHMNFKKWGEKNKKRTGLGIITVYYKNS